MNHATKQSGTSLAIAALAILLLALPNLWGYTLSKTLSLSIQEVDFFALLIFYLGSIGLLASYAMGLSFKRLDALIDPLPKWLIAAGILVIAIGLALMIAIRQVSFLNFFGVAVVIAAVWGAIGLVWPRLGNTKAVAWLWLLLTLIVIVRYRLQMQFTQGRIYLVMALLLLGLAIWWIVKLPSDERKSALSIAANAALLTASTVFAFWLAERMYVWTNTNLRSFDRPEANSSEQPRRVVTTNSLGFRDDEPAITPPPDKVRIIAIGDSFTEGAFSIEDRWTTQLEEIGQPYVEVLNFGKGGYSVENYHQVLTDKASRYSPDFVIIALSSNDIEYPANEWGYHQFEPTRFRFFRHFADWQSFRWYDGLLNDAAEQLNLVYGYDDYYAFLKDPDNEAHDYRLGMVASINDALASQGVEAVVIYLTQPALEPNDILIEEFEMGSIPIHTTEDLLVDRFADVDPLELQVGPLDAHPGTRVNRAYAEFIWDIIEEDTLALYETKDTP